MDGDIDLIRDILLKIENGQQLFEPISSDDATALGMTLEKPMTRKEVAATLAAVTPTFRSVLAHARFRAQ
jgi:hypothetical protein